MLKKVYNEVEALLIIGTLVFGFVFVVSVISKTVSHYQTIRQQVLLESHKVELEGVQLHHARTVTQMKFDNAKSYCTLIFDNAKGIQKCMIEVLSPPKKSTRKPIKGPGKVKPNE